uniref:Uncharacterized protein n=1 Tax=Varanus komodoensis TaxID=61221 RepID=A0A8D2LE29_VARKO
LQVAFLKTIKHEILIHPYPVPRAGNHLSKRSLEVFQVFRIGLRFPITPGPKPFRAL